MTRKTLIASIAAGIAMGASKTLKISFPMPPQKWASKTIFLLRGICPETNDNGD